MSIKRDMTCLWVVSVYLEVEIALSNAFECGKFVAAVSQNTSTCVLTEALRELSTKDLPN